jgi:magnesium chelatase subunit I
MNPEEGSLRSQIMDRFGLRVIVRGLENETERLEAYRRAKTYRINPRGTVAQFRDATDAAREEIQLAKNRLPQVEIADAVASAGIRVIRKLGIDSLRAEMTLFEAARALAAADGRTEVSPDDLRTVAPMALRLRRSAFMQQFFTGQTAEDQEVQKTLDEIIPSTE